MCACVDEHLELITGASDVTTPSDVTSTCSQSHESVVVLFLTAVVSVLLAVFHRHLLT